MLWERTDAATALPERFGIVDASTAATLVTNALLEHGGLRVTTCEQIVLSAQNLLAWVRIRPARLW